MITADHIRFYREGKQFYPSVLHETGSLDISSDVAFVVLPCLPDDDLKWGDAALYARKWIAAGRLILWHFDFGWEDPKCSLTDETAFLSYTVAIDEFVQKLWSEFQEHTFGVCVYRGEVGFARFEKAEFVEWAQELGIERPSALHEQLFTCELFSQMMHRLLSFFPESVLAFACIDLESCLSPALQALMVATLRLDHLHLALKGARAPLSRLIWEESGSLSCTTQEPQVAVCIPKNFNCQKLLDPLLIYLQINHGEFRLIAEARLTEEWDGINTLIVISEMMSSLGERKLKGFEAAGGEIISWAKKS